MAITHPIPIDVLRQLLRLDAETGKLYWLPRGIEWFKDTGLGGARGACNRWNGRLAGREAFTASREEGYRVGAIFDRPYKAHRVVFALHHGRWPDVEIDHQDGDPANNRPSNLREATRRQNVQNRSGNRNTSSQYCGVCWDKRRGNWMAHITKTGRKFTYLGAFSDEMDAAKAYDDAAKIEHGEFARLNFPGGE